MAIDPAEIVYEESAGDVTLSVPEVAAMLGVGETAVRQGCRSGEIPSLRLGRLVVIPREALMRRLAGVDGELYTAEQVARRVREAVIAERIGIVTRLMETLRSMPEDV